ncbi:hypothetical protein SMICM17S_05902 [Streptomyces microflavus]
MGPPSFGTIRKLGFACSPGSSSSRSPLASVVAVTAVGASGPVPMAAAASANRTAAAIRAPVMVPAVASGPSVASAGMAGAAYVCHRIKSPPQRPVDLLQPSVIFPEIYECSQLFTRFGCLFMRVSRLTDHMGPSRPQIVRGPPFSTWEHMRIRATVAVATGALALSALAIPAAQAARSDDGRSWSSEIELPAPKAPFGAGSGIKGEAGARSTAQASDIKVFGLLVNGGKPIVVGTKSSRRFPTP